MLQLQPIQPVFGRVTLVSFAIVGVYASGTALIPQPQPVACNAPGQLSWFLLQHGNAVKNILQISSLRIVDGCVFDSKTQCQQRNKNTATAARHGVKTCAKKCKNTTHT